MKRMAGMQPYFFPYLGYWQLIDAVDCFVLFDEAQYIKQGWVNRNRILKREGGWQYIGVPVAKHAMTCAIRDVLIADAPHWKKRVLSQLAAYRTSAPFYKETINLVKYDLLNDCEKNIAELNCGIIRKLAKILSIKSRILVSSEYGFDYRSVSSAGDFAFVHAQHLGAEEIINPVNGVHMLDTEKLNSSNIKIKALHPPQITYPQGGNDFESSLSIIDVLMFNGIYGTTNLLSMRKITAFERSVLPQRSIN